MYDLVFLQDIKFTTDNYVAVSVKESERINEYEFSIVNSSTNNLINCIKDRYEPNGILYYVENYVPIKQVLSRTIFSMEDFRKILNEIINLIIWIKEQKLVMSNILLDIDYIFVDKYSNEVKIMYIPVASKLNANLVLEGIKNLLREIVENSTINNGNELVGLILSNINRKNIDLEKFQRDMYKIQNRNIDDNRGKERIKGALITISAVAFFTIIIPLVTKKLGVKYLKDYITYKGIIENLILLIAAIIFAVIICVVSTKKKKKEDGVKDNYTTSYSSELKGIASNLRNNSGSIEHSKVKVEEVLNREYNPLEHKEIDSQASKIQQKKPETIEVNKVKEGTEFLISTENKVMPYIIKEGSRSVSDRIYIDKDKLLVGRDKNATDILIMKPSVSKKHAIILKDKDEFYIIDNNSSNGTFLNSVKLEGEIRYKLKDKDKIIFANQNYNFYID